VESQSELERFLADCPQAGLILDVGHLGGAGGDAEYIADKYFDRITAVHIKDWYVRDPSAGEWYKRGYFTALGLGNVDVNNEGVVRLLKKRAYDKWLMVELDSHKEEPQKELSGCLETVKGWLE
jgi:inosose dehydratase